jgi:hypothetical protein
VAFTSSFFLFHSWLLCIIWNTVHKIIQYLNVKICKARIAPF